MSGDFYSKIREFTVTAKGARRKVVTFLLQKPEEAAFMTIEGLAEVSGVSAGMVSRTVREMGFDGFADMQNQIRQVVRRNISRSARLRRARQEGVSFRDTIRWELRNLAKLVKLNSEETVQKAANMLAKAPAVHVMGLRSSFAPAYSLVFGLGQIREYVYLMDLGFGLLAEQAKRLAAGELMVLISFPRYVRESLLMAQEAKTAGCQILAITDSFSSPLAMQADLALLAPFESSSYFNSTIAMYGITNALLVETAQALGERGVQELERLNAIEQRWKLLINSEDAWRPNLKDE
ncbi:putative Transcriptional regulator, RpiR family [uncultured delta proteobacterium]|uniref:Putative Transcriptional regulator, RpiR family n=1 Tax=uncultured delta proteobacterium TaxID=34034 RepID=A0A212JQ07_9DELT|nr:putative Transcriptional regulator, RpiR family [uncultured delta proteobacterium]